MKVGVFAVLFAQRPFEEALDYIAQAGCGAVEIGAGGYPGAAHCDPAALLADEAARARFTEAVASRGLEISALSCHGNPSTPIGRSPNSTMPPSAIRSASPKKSASAPSSPFPVARATPTRRKSRTG